MYSLQPSVLLVSGEQTFTTNFAVPERGNWADGPQERRREQQGDPYENLEAMYRLAEVSWARGDFEFFKAERNLTG